MSGTPEASFTIEHETSDTKTFAPRARKSCRYAHLQKHSLHATQSGTMCFCKVRTPFSYLSLLEKTYELDA